MDKSIEVFTMEESTYRRPIQSVEVGGIPASAHTTAKEIEAGQDTKTVIPLYRYLR